jgi:hypothetical protein
MAMLYLGSYRLDRGMVCTLSRLVFLPVGFTVDFSDWEDFNNHVAKLEKKRR